METAKVWEEKGFAEAGFTDYVSDEDRVSFPWTMIDKITPRPGEEICEMLTGLGVEDMQPVVTARHTYIAPYAKIISRTGVRRWKKRVFTWLTVRRSTGRNG